MNLIKLRSDTSTPWHVRFSQQSLVIFCSNYVSRVRHACNIFIPLASFHAVFVSLTRTYLLCFIYRILGPQSLFIEILNYDVNTYFGTC